MTEAEDWGGLSEEDILELVAPSPILVEPKISHVWVAIYITEGCSLPMVMTGTDRNQVISWVRGIAALDRTKPIKLYRLEY